MHTKTLELYTQMVDLVRTNEDAHKFALQGSSSIWTSIILDLIERLDSGDLSIIAEARCVETEPGLMHTFVELQILEGDHRETFILNGVDTSKIHSYYGVKSQAPLLLQTSRPDPINIYRALDEGLLASLREKDQEHERQIQAAFATWDPDGILEFLNKMEQGTLVTDDLEDLPDSPIDIFVRSQSGKVYVLKPLLFKLVMLNLIETESL